MRHIRTAIVCGGGGIATVQASATVQAPEAELVALCDVNEEGLQRYASQYQVAAYTKYSELLKRDDIEMIQISTPDYLHAEQTIAAAEAGKHILCQKPMAVTRTEARAMRDAVERAGVKFISFQNMRWELRNLALKEIIDSGDIGQPVYAFYSVKGRFYPYPPDHYCRGSACGGQFVRNGAHYVDLVAWLMGALPVEVYGKTTSHFPDPTDTLETDNYILCSLRLDNDTMAAVEANLTLIDPPGFPRGNKFTIVGTKGIIEAGYGDNKAVTYFIDGRISYSGAPRLGISEPGNPLVRTIRDFALSILDDRDPSIPIDDSIRVLDACLGTLESARTGSPVRLDSESWGFD